MIDPNEVIHLCAGRPMSSPHTMGILRNGRFIEVVGRWDGQQWVDLRVA